MITTKTVFLLFFPFEFVNIIIVRVHSVSMCNNRINIWKCMYCIHRKKTILPCSMANKWIECKEYVEVTRTHTQARISSHHAYWLQNRYTERVYHPNMLHHLHTQYLSINQWIGPYFWHKYICTLNQYVIRTFNQ